MLTFALCEIYALKAPRGNSTSVVSGRGTQVTDAQKKAGRGESIIVTSVDSEPSNFPRHSDLSQLTGKALLSHSVPHPG